MMINRTLLSLSLISIMYVASVNTSYAEIVYKWVDSNGITHYGDEERLARQNGAKQISVKAPKVGTENVSSSDYVPSRQDIRSVNNNSNVPLKVRITSPQNGEQIRANNGVINVSSSVSPTPTGNYSTKVFIDGALFGSANNSTSVQVQGVPRGEHDVTVKIQTQNGKIFASNSVHFIVFRVAAGKH